MSNMSNNINNTIKMYLLLYFFINLHKFLLWLYCLFQNGNKRNDWVRKILKPGENVNQDPFLSPLISLANANLLAKDTGHPMWHHNSEILWQFSYYTNLNWNRSQKSSCGEAVMPALTLASNLWKPADIKHRSVEFFIHHLGSCDSVWKCKK